MRKRIGALAVLAVAAGMSGVYGQTFTAIDAVTSASGKLSLKSGKAYATTAEITWRDSYSNGTQQLLKWGTTTSYGSQKNLKPFTAGTDITTTITPLTPATKYYGQFYRVYEGTTHTTNFTFTTAAATGIVSRPAGSVVRTLFQDVTVSITSLNGRAVRSQSVNSLAASDLDAIFSLSKLGQGAYIATVRDQRSGAVLLSSKKVVE